MILTDLDTLLWAAGFLGNAVLLTVLLLRHRARSFPWFAAFIGGSLVRTAILFFLFRHYEVRTYFLTFWSLAILIDVVLQGVVVFEAAGHVFRPLGRWAPDARRGMAWIVCSSLLVAGVLAVLATPVSALWQEAIVLKANFFFSVLMSELLIGMVFLAVTVGLPWRTHVARIAQGLGAYSLLSLLLDALQAIFASHGQTSLQMGFAEVRKVGYLLSEVYWIATLWQQAPAPRELPVEARQQLRDLQSRLAYDLYTLRSGRRP